MADYDITGVNKWALGERLKTDRFYWAEIAGAAWYIDNYSARAVPPACAFVRCELAPQGVIKTMTARLTMTQETPLHDTGKRREITAKKKSWLVCVYATADGVEVGVRDDYRKQIVKGNKVWADITDPAQKALTVRGSDDQPIAVMMPVKLSSEEGGTR